MSGVPPTFPTLLALSFTACEELDSCLDLSSFSKQGLIRQLSSKAGEGFPRKDAGSGFTHAQAVHAVDKVGL